MSGLAFVASYVSFSVVIAAIWMWFRLRHQPGRQPAALAASFADVGKPFLKRFAGPYGRSLFVGAALTMLTVGLNLAAPWPLLLVVDNGVFGEPLPDQLGALENVSASGLVAIGAGATVALVALGSSLNYLARYINGAAQIDIAADIRSAAYIRLQDAAVSTYEAPRSEDRLARLSVDVHRVEDALIAWLGTALPGLLTVFGVVVVVASIEPVFAAPVLVVVAGMAWRMRRTYRTARRDERSALRQPGATPDDDGDGLHDQSSTPEPSGLHLVADRLDSRPEQGRKVAPLAPLGRSANVSPITEVLFATGAALMLYLGAVRVLDDVISIGVLFVLLAYTAQLFGPTAQLPKAGLAMAEGATSADRLVALFASQRSVRESPSEIEAPRGPIPLRVHDVAFGYNNTWPELRNINFSVAPGEVVCVVGLAGAGKSSLFSLLVGLYDPATGAVELGGTDIRHLELVSVRSRIAVVPQDLWVIDGTIADNIAFGCPGATADDIQTSARLAMADEFIQAFPVGYDTIVGNQGAVLSKGQRRQLALARALLRKAPILILDEPTAGLDGAAADQVWRAVSSVRTERAVLVVTDDLDVAAHADRIYAVEKGSTVASGDHETLISRGGHYMALWAARTRRAAIPSTSIREQPDPAAVAVVDVREASAVSPAAKSVATASNFAPSPEETERLIGDVLAGVVGVERVPVDGHFFDDLGADSMVMARFCARLRKETDLPTVSMKQVYEHPTVHSLATAVAGQRPTNDRSPDLEPVAAQAVRPVGPLTYGLCGALQLVTMFAYSSLLAIGLMAGSRWIADGSGVVDNLLRTVAVGNAIVVGVVIVPILAKWALIGRWKPQTIRVWSLAYYRFWVVKTLVTLNPLALSAGSPIYVLYLRALGAKIGRDVVILSRRVPVCTDLLTIGDGTVIRKDSFFNCYRAHGGLIETGWVTLGQDVVVGELTVVDINTSMGDHAQLGHSSSLIAGQSVPAGEHRCGSPARTRTFVDYRGVPGTTSSRFRKTAFTAAQLLNWLVLSSLMYSIVFVVASAIADRSYLKAPELTAFSGGALYGESFVIAGLFLFGAILVGLVGMATIPRLLYLTIDPETVYPLYGYRYLAHRAISRLTNVRFFLHLFGDSSYVVSYLRWLGYDLSERVVQTGSNFGTAVKHDNPYLVSIGRGTMIADGLSIINADYSSTSFRLSPVKIGAHNFLGNQVAYPSQGRTGRNCLLATKVMVPVDGELRRDVGLLGAPSFEIPRSVLRDSGLNHPESDEELDHRLAAKDRHNFMTIGLFLAGEWAFLFLSVLLGLSAVILFPTTGPLVLALAVLLIVVLRVLYQILLERASTLFRRLRPQQCSIYEPDFWSHERYWKLAVRPIHLAIFAGTPLKTFFWRLMGVRIGRHVFDDGCIVTERTLVAIGDHATLNVGSVIQSHSQEDGGFKCDHIAIGAGCTVGTSSLVHYGVTMGDGAELAPGAFLMKGEEVPPHTRWEDNPAHQTEGDVIARAAMTTGERIRLIGDGKRNEVPAKQLV